MTMEYPAMAFKRGSMFEWDGEMFDYVIVADRDEADIALADGWVFHKPTDEPEPAKEPPRRGRPPKAKEPVE